MRFTISMLDYLNIINFTFFCIYLFRNTIKLYLKTLRNYQHYLQNKEFNFHKMKLMIFEVFHHRRIFLSHLAY